MREQITQDLAATAAKTAPPAAVAAASVAGALDPQSILIWLTIIYTASLLLTNVVKNWGEWMTWWAKRWAQAKRVWAWFRRRE